LWWCLLCSGDLKTWRKKLRVLLCIARRCIEQWR
jgi:hypothetical protein